MSVSALHILYKKDFEPLVRPLENVAIATDLDDESWEFYKVMYIEPFFIKYTTDTITNGSYLDVSINSLELHDNVVGQIRITELTSGFEIEVSLPEATKKYSTKNSVTRIDNYIVSNYPHFTEMFYKGDNTPKFTVYNLSGSDGSATIRIIGLKYILEKLLERPREFTVIYVSTVIPK